MSHAVQASIGALLDVALTTETASFDEESFRTNLTRMLTRGR